KLAEMYIADPLKVGETRWLNTGWMEMNRVLGGWQPGLHIVLGASHMGKSYFLQHAVANVADNGGRAAVYSLEMASSEIMTRMALATARTTKYRFERGDISDDQRGSLVDRLAQMHDWDVVFDDRAESLQSIISGIRGEFRKAALDLVVIDYLGLIEGVEADNRNLSLGIITRRLKLLSRELSIPVIVAHQISDKIIERRSNKRPTAADAYESGHVKQDADTVLGLYRDDVYNRDTETPHIMEVRVLKDRLGGNTGKVAMLYFDQFGQMLDAATNSEYEPQADDAPEWTKQTGAGFNL
ncbi:MAG TPA: DnaB-like helicase C-terminal domain-containing protein, partial [Anaerolineae bacterium]|nr:DnaB-like helicase C-terminal domain-containing protein [Anaerolineae bacterium]